MNRWQALQNFWGSFGLPAYDENAVPDDAQMPYITYEAQSGTFDEPVMLTASVWYKDSAWDTASLKSNEIQRTINFEGHVCLKIDEGYIYITAGSPFAQRGSDEDDMVKRIIFNINAEFLTAY